MMTLAATMPVVYSTVPRSASNPAKPDRSDDSPFYWHATGRWAKKIRGRLVYFGSGSHADALATYEEQRQDLHAGRVPHDRKGLTVYDLCDEFLKAKKCMRDAGELSPITFRDYSELAKRLLKVFGRNRLVSDLRPEDFARLRARMAKTWGPVRLKAEIVRARVPFNWAQKNKLIDLPIAFGDAFAPPSKKTIRTHRQAKGPRMFEADEIRRMLTAASLPLRAMLLLGIQAGFGNTDVGSLPLTALDLVAGVSVVPKMTQPGHLLSFAC